MHLLYSIECYSEKSINVEVFDLEIRRRFGKIQINLFFRSPCTNFALKNGRIGKNIPIRSTQSYQRRTKTHNNQCEK